ncbi:Uu.00g122660.m01.CDS01 [Anthostomella pinea]|uniref:Uu.00g122660.m01.CDS01 n=1 Tax=Anthostomella pinea TaxID=933095 RepID=A0AAI8VH98_9PEZI|nr:Uu.00g122660.m01.CDS01 [Anthostomella pinea]
MASIRDLLLPIDVDPIKPKPREGKVPADDVNAPPQPSLTSRFTIEIILDTICPFCYIGLNNLNTAIAIHQTQHPEAVFDVTCSPLVLAPSASYDKLSYYTEYMGLPSDRYAVWTEYGTEAGINFSWKGRTGNSRDSHKLLRFALESTPTVTRSVTVTQPRQTTTLTGTSTAASNMTLPPPNPPGQAVSYQTSMRHASAISAGSVVPSSPKTRGPALQMRLLEAIFKGYHELDRDLSERQFLVETAVGVTGFAARDIEAVLDSDEWGRAIDMLCAEVRRRLPTPIIAVPTIIVNGKWLYGGRQPVEYLVAEFERIRLGQPRNTKAATNTVPESGVGRTGVDGSRGVTMSMPDESI